MQNKYIVKIYDWENPRLCSSADKFREDDSVIIETDLGTDLGIIQNVDVDTKEKPTNTILRRATKSDIKLFEENKKKKKEVSDVCHSEIKRLELEMKIIDVHLSLGKGGIIVVFIADNRIDFRQLVKNISKIFRRSVRIHQIGSRDEARKLGGCGICGKELCCVKFSGEMPSISTEMARVQQVAHRGSERISGLCGRLMCCLSYEFDQYRGLLKGMPETHSIIKTKEGKGEVLEVNAITQKVRIRLEDGQMITLSKEEL